MPAIERDPEIELHVSNSFEGIKKASDKYIEISITSKENVDLTMGFSDRTSKAVNFHIPEKCG